MRYNLIDRRIHLQTSKMTQERPWENNAGVFQVRELGNWKTRDSEGEFSHFLYFLNFESF